MIRRLLRLESPSAGMRRRGRLLCRLGLHRWYTVPSGLFDLCARCGWDR